MSKRLNAPDGDLCLVRLTWALILGMAIVFAGLASLR